MVIFSEFLLFCDDYNFVIAISLVVVVAAVGLVVFAESVCGVLSGCSSYSQFPDFDGAFSNLTASTCLAQSGPPTSSNVTERSGTLIMLLQ